MQVNLYFFNRYLKHKFEQEEDLSKYYSFCLLNPKYTLCCKGLLQKTSKASKQSKNFTSNGTRNQEKIEPELTRIKKIINGNGKMKYRLKKIEKINETKNFIFEKIKMINLQSHSPSK